MEMYIVRVSKILFKEKAMLISDELRVKITQAIAEDDTPVCDDEGELTHDGIDTLVNIMQAVIENETELPEAAQHTAAQAWRRAYEKLIRDSRNAEAD
jgi:hypothetical protein